ncbi:MAG: hypothetical protein VB035_10025 [Candidatus Fimivivens sp.]|nr:hypothetical protein [Candidatus Fimivivens sp.]
MNRIQRAGEAAKNYLTNRRKLGAMRRYAKRGRTLQVDEDQTVTEVAAVDKAFAAISSDGQALQLVDLLYRKRGHPSVSGCARALLMPIDQAHKHNKAFLRLVANNFDIKGE